MTDLPKIEIDLCVTIEGIGQCVVPFEDLNSIQSDPLGYAADLAGVSRDSYLRFLRDDKSDKCTAITASGNRCQIYVRCPQGVKEFESDERLCGLHKGCGAKFGRIK